MASKGTVRRSCHKSTSTIFWLWRKTDCEKFGSVSGDPAICEPWLAMKNTLSHCHTPS